MIDVNSLPAELKTNIFIQFDDLRDVLALSSASKSFRTALLSVESIIVSHIVLRRIDSELHREVAAVVKSSLITPALWTLQRVEDVLHCYFERNDDISTIEWTLSIGASVARVHDLVETFAGDFILSALTKLDEPGDGLGVSGVVVSESETLRCRTAFWRFELYCNLFRGQEPKNQKRPKRIDGTDQKVLFFDHLAPYENEQLACVHDFLYDEVSEAFSDVASHDIEWACDRYAEEESVEWVDDYMSERIIYKAALLSRGLAGIQEIRDTKSYDDRYNLLQGPSLGLPEMDFHFLFEGLKCDDDFWSDNLRLEDLSTEDAKRRATPPFTAEDNDGPFEAWKWANGPHIFEYYFEPENYYFRQRAYVMWNKAILEQWGILAIDRRSIPEEWTTTHIPTEAQRQEERRSILARRHVYKRGGLGWWSATDETRLVFPSDQKKYAAWLEKREKARKPSGGLTFN